MSRSIRSKLSVSLILTCAATSVRAGEPPFATHVRAEQLDGISLAFVPNRGQFAPYARFQADGLRGSIAVHEDGVTVHVPAATAERHGQVVSIRHLDALATADVTASDDAGPSFSYLYGRDSTRWVRGARSGRGVRIAGLYAGIDLELGGDQRKLKGTYRVAAGADPTRIRWRYAGATEVARESSGALSVTLPAAAGERACVLLEDAPVAWQESARGRAAVEVEFAVDDDGTVGFRLGAFDESRELVIDPTIAWSTLLGGAGTDLAYDVDSEGDGFAYVTGFAHSNDMPNGPLPLQGAGASAPVQWWYGGEVRDAFVLKLDLAVAGSNRPQMVYCTRLGGGRRMYAGDPQQGYIAGCVESYPKPSESAVGEDRGYGIAVDANGSAIVVGWTMSDDFPGTVGSATPCVVVANDPSPHSFTPYAPADPTANAGCAFGNPLSRIGAQCCPMLPIHGNTLFRPSGEMIGTAGLIDAFVTKLTPDGSGIVYSTYFPTFANPAPGYLPSLPIEAAFDVDTDDSGNAYVVGMGGYLPPAPYAPTAGAPQASFGGGTFDGYVLKLDACGQGVAATYIGGAADDFATGVRWQNGNVYVCGITQGPGIVTTTNAFQSSYAGPGGGCGASTPPLPSFWTDVTLGDFIAAGDGFVAVMPDSLQGAFSYCSFVSFGADLLEACYDVEVDSGLLYLCGMRTQSVVPCTSGPPPTQPDLLVFALSFDAFMCVIDPTVGPPSALVAQHTLAGGSMDFATAIDVSGSRVCITGATFDDPTRLFTGLTGATINQVVGAVETNSGTSSLGISFSGGSFHNGIADAFYAEFATSAGYPYVSGAYLGCNPVGPGTNFTNEIGFGLAFVGPTRIFIAGELNLPPVSPFDFPLHYPLWESALFNAGNIFMGGVMPNNVYSGAFFAGGSTDAWMLTVDLGP